VTYDDQRSSIDKYLVGIIAASLPKGMNAVLLTREGGMKPMQTLNKPQVQVLNIIGTGMQNIIGTMLARVRQTNIGTDVLQNIETELRGSASFEEAVMALGQHVEVC